MVHDAGAGVSERVLKCRPGGTVAQVPQHHGGIALESSRSGTPEGAALEVGIELVIGCAEYPGQIEPGMARPGGEIGLE